MKPSDSSNYTGFAFRPGVICLVVVCSMLWGSAFPALKTGFAMLGIETNSAAKIYFAACRFFLAGIMIFAGVIMSGKSVALPRKTDYAVVCLLGIFQTTLQYIFFYIGLSNTSGMKSSILSGSGSFFMVIGTHFFISGDRLTGRTILGLALGFAGLVSVNMPQMHHFDMNFRMTGEGFILLSVLFGTIGAFIVKKAAVRVYPPLLSAWQLTIGALLLFAVSAGLESPAVPQFSPASAALLVYLSGVSAAAFSMWYMLIKNNPLSHIAVYRFMIPVFGTLLSAAVLETETLSPHILISLMLVSSGMILTSIER